MDAMIVARKTAAPFHTGLSQYAGVDDDDVGHGKEGRQTGNNLCAYGSAVFFQLEKSFHIFSSIWNSSSGGIDQRRAAAKIVWDRVFLRTLSLMSLERLYHITDLQYRKYHERGIIFETKEIILFQTVFNGKI